MQTDESLSSPKSYLPIFILILASAHMFNNIVEQKKYQKLIDFIFSSLPKTESHVVLTGHLDVGRDVAWVLVQVCFFFNIMEGTNDIECLMLLTKKNMNISVHGMSLYILDIKHNLNMYNRKGNIQNSLIDSY